LVPMEWSGAFVAKNFDTTSFSELVRYCCHFSHFCIDIPAVPKRSGMPQNMSFGSKWVGRCVHCKIFRRNFI
jgi:hypothetical protein